MLTYTRASRDYDFVPGFGGAVAIYRYLRSGYVWQLAGPVLLDLHEWTLQSKTINAETTHTGSNGAILRTPVAADWRFAGVTSFPARALVEGEGTNTTITEVPVALPFLEQAFNSRIGVAMVFYLGDPLWWQAENLNARSHRAKRARLETMETRLDSTGTKMIGLNLEVSGNSLLLAYEGDVVRFPTVW